MVTTPKTPIDSSAAHEFVTSGYFGSIPGDPRGGKTRVVTNNDCNHGATNMGTPIYYMGVQENGGRSRTALANRTSMVLGRLAC